MPAFRKLRAATQKVYSLGILDWSVWQQYPKSTHSPHPKNHALTAEDAKDAEEKRRESIYRDFSLIRQLSAAATIGGTGA
jgi:hypothetical protein